jgi:ribosome-associated protein
MTTADTRTDAPKKAGLPDAVARAIEAARDKKALDLVALDLRHLSSFTDFFVICSGQNVRQVQAIADAVESALKKEQVKPAHIEGFAHADWVLLDYFTFVVHVFSTERRAFFALEKLWGSAERVALPEPAPPQRKRD